MSDRSPVVRACWACKGHPWAVYGVPLSAFDVGETAVNVEGTGGLGAVTVVRHRRDGVTLYESHVSGQTRQLNSEANHFFVEERMVDETLALLAKVSKVNAAIDRAARKEGLR